MVKEAYVSFDVAKLLKNKGFDGDCENECHMFYHEMTDRIMPIMEIGMVPDYDTVYFAPTHQMVMAWLREAYGIHVSAIPCAKQHTIVWQQNIINLKPIKEGGMFLQLEPHRKDYNSYEEAVEAALKYSLENLI